MAEIGKLTVAIEGDNSNLDKALKDSTKATSSAMSSIATSLASAATGMKLLGAIAEGINLNKAAEQAQVSFEVMTGSAEEAQRVLGELRDFAENTPLEFSDIRDATQTLLAFGIESEDAVEAIKMLGDVSGGNADKLKSLATVFGQISANGKLTGGDLLQLVNVGFNPLQEISERTGQSMADLRKEMESGQISFAMVEESFKNVTSEGGRFYGMLEQQAGTLEGKVSTMNDAISVAMGKMTEAFMEPMKLGADIVTAMAEGFGALPGPVQAFTGTIVALGGAVAVATGALGAMGVAIGPLLVAAGPFVALGVAIAGVGVAIASAVGAENQRNLEEANRQFSQLAVNLGKTGAEQEKFIKSTVEAEKYLSQLDDILANFGGDDLAVAEQFASIAEDAGLTKDEMARIVIESGKYSAELENVARLNLSIKEQNEINARIEAQRFEVQRKAYAEAADNFYRLNPQIARARDEQRLRDQEATAQLATQARLSAQIQAINDAIVRGGLSEIEGNKLKIQLREKEIQSIQEQLTQGQRLNQTEIDRIALLQSYNKDNQRVIDAAIKREQELADTKQSLIVQTYESEEEYQARTLALNQQIDDAIAYSKVLSAQQAYDARQEYDERQAEKDLARKENYKSDMEEMAKVAEEQAKLIQAAWDGVGNSLKTMIGEGFLTIMTDMGTALKTGASATDALGASIANLGYEISRAIPNLLLNAGLPLLSTPATLPIGLALIGASGLVALGNATGVTDALGNAFTGAMEGIGDFFTGVGDFFGFANGTDFAPGGMALVGEQGPELVNLPRGSQVFPASETRDMLGGGGMNVIVNNYSPEALDPARSAELTRASMRQLSFEGAFA